MSTIATTTPSSAEAQRSSARRKLYAYGFGAIPGVAITVTFFDFLLASGAATGNIALALAEQSGAPGGAPGGALLAGALTVMGGASAVAAGAAVTAAAGKAFLLYAHGPRR